MVVRVLVAGRMPVDHIDQHTTGLVLQLDTNRLVAVVAAPSGPTIQLVVRFVIPPQVQHASHLYCDVIAYPVNRQ